VSAMTSPDGDLPVLQQAAKSLDLREAGSRMPGDSRQTICEPPATVVQVVGWALADIDVREPSAALLAPLALILFSLGESPSHSEGSIE
jgi:hypothetical protein